MMLLKYVMTDSIWVRFGLTFATIEFLNWMNWGNNGGYDDESWSCCDACEDVGIIGKLDKRFGKSSK